MYDKQSSHRDKVVAAIIVTTIGCVLLVLYIERASLLSKLTMYRSNMLVSDIVGTVINAIILLLYTILFGILGYKKSLQKNVNTLLWTVVCAVTGVWGYLWLLLFAGHYKDVKNT